MWSVGFKWDGLGGAGWGWVKLQEVHTAKAAVLTAVQSAWCQGSDVIYISTTLHAVVSLTLPCRNLALPLLLLG